jgi:hypothetical protein
MAELLADALDVLHLAHHPFSQIYNSPAWFSNTCQALAITLKYLQVKLFLQQLNLLANARLRRMQSFRGDRNIEALARHFAHVAKLM